MSESHNSGETAPADANHGSHHPGAHHGGLAKLAIGAIGVVFGDIGTSPLYAFRETFASHHGAPGIQVDPIHIQGVLSLVFWSMMIVVTFKYVLTIMKADNKGEGGSLALLALINRKSENAKWTAPFVLLGVFATALFYGDSMITPAMSVLSATEGLQYVHPGFKAYIVPLAVTILFALFAIQSRGTDKVGKLFGPIMLIYFLTLAGLGILHLGAMPQVILETINPVNALRFFVVDGFRAFVAMGSVVLAVTGAEALYADMGHFGRKPITIAWLSICVPALMTNYMGQAAMLMRHPEYVDNPFFHMVPPSLTIPLLVIATLATIIASQAVITGAFSVTRQAIQLGFIPRMQIKHTSTHAQGQIYLPTINWALAAAVALLVVAFQHSAAMLPAYGLAVVGTMLITTLMQYIVVFRIWRSPLWRGGIGFVVFITIDLLFLASGLTKLLEGAWFPILVGAALFTLMTTWARGRALLRERLADDSLPLADFIASVAKSVHRVRGTAVFLSAAEASVPSALLHNLKHNQVLHERVVLLTVAVADVPQVDPAQRATTHGEGHGFYRVVLHYGFMEEVDIPRDLCAIRKAGPPFNMMATSFFLGRQKLVASNERPGMALWREHLFAWLSKSSESAMEFFKLPTNRVVELGSQVKI
ncbi:MAG: potassium transporter Kup [Novosphingobium sp.]